MNPTQTRKAFARAWKAWRKAQAIRKATTRLTGNRNGPAKAWADETRIIMKRAERQHRRALQNAKTGANNVDQETRDRLKAIATRWGINYSTIETVAKMAAARLHREGLPATEENASQALQEANALCLEMSQRMLDNPQASARAIRQQLERAEGWTAKTA